MKSFCIHCKQHINHRRRCKKFNQKVEDDYIAQKKLEEIKKVKHEEDVVKFRETLPELFEYYEREKKNSDLDKALLNGYQNKYHTDVLQCCGNGCTNKVYYYEQDGAGFRFQDYDDSVHALTVTDKDDNVIESVFNKPEVGRCFMKTDYEKPIVVFCSAICADYFRYTYGDEDGFMCKQCLPLCHMCNTPTRCDTDYCGYCNRPICDSCKSNFDGEYRKICKKCSECIVCKTYDENRNTYKCTGCYELCCEDCSKFKDKK